MIKVVGFIKQMVFCNKPLRQHQNNYDNNKKVSKLIDSNNTTTTKYNHYKLTIKLWKQTLLQMRIDYFMVVALR